MKAFGFATLILIAGFWNSFSHAGERHEFYTGIRGLGMGGVQIATVNDETSVLINPAGLGRLRNNFLTVVDPEIGISSTTESIIDLDITAAYDVQKTLDLLSSGNQGKHLHQKVQLFPSFVVPNFGMGLLAKYQVDAEIDADDNYLYQYTKDYAFVMGYNFRLFDGRLKLGFNTRIVNRTEINALVPATSTDLKNSDLAKEGLGIASDAGLLISMPWDWLPTIGVVYRDIGTTKYNLQDGLFMKTDEDPTPTRPTLDAAIAVFPIMANRTRATISVEYRDILPAPEEDESAEEESIYRKLHAGIEFNFSDFFFIRAGMNQKFWTAGLEFAVFNYQLQVATYGEDIGDGTTLREDRRYVGKLAYRF